MSPMALATYVMVSLFAVSYILFFIVVTIGGFFDLKKLIRCIKVDQIDLLDDNCESGKEEAPPPR
ncbi:hypothetical protein P0Y35_00430 [Kiritimatiellaeota bacterium B1221]|nr:hypothetical protein [Kiritimatiellaeota bacterium B1221]